MGDKPWPASSSGSTCSRIARQRSNSACQLIGRACATGASISISSSIAASIFFMTGPPSAKVALTTLNLVPAPPKNRKGKVDWCQCEKTLVSSSSPRCLGPFYPTKDKMISLRSLNLACAIGRSLLLKRFSLMPFPLLDDPQPRTTGGKDHHDDQNGVLYHWNALS